MSGGNLMNPSGTASLSLKRGAQGRAGQGRVWYHQGSVWDVTMPSRKVPGAFTGAAEPGDPLGNNCLYWGRRE